MLLKLLEKYGRKRIIFDRDNPNDAYLERYFPLFRVRPKWFPFNVLIHHFVRSDNDTFHDHPWAWASFILRGGYWEHTPNGCFWRRAGTLRFGRATDLHYVELDKEKANGETWTLFFVGKRVREWGFSVDGRWIQWEKYLKLKNHPIDKTSRS